MTTATTPTTPTRLARWGALAVGVTVLATGCSMNAAELPVPGSYVSGDSYSIDIEFSSVLNLPDKAKVVVDGVDAGVLDHVVLTTDESGPSRAVATVDLSSDVRLPVGTRAELRQSTILGEIYVTLLPPENATGGDLGDGDTIPIQDTVPADNVEDVLRGLSEVVSGGHIVEFQNAIKDFNQSIPTDPGVFDRINTAARQGLNDLTTNTYEIDRILNAAAGVSQTLVDNSANLDMILSVGPERTAGLADALFVVVDLTFALGYMSRNIVPVLGPVYTDLRGIISILKPAVLTVANIDITIPMNVEKTNALLREKLIPFLDSPPNVNITSVRGESGGEVDSVDRANEMIQVMRSIGIVQ